MKRVDILIAVRNEEENIPIFIEKINQLVLPEFQVNIIFLEDGSTDDTILVLRNLAKKQKNVQYFSLSNKHGQYAALLYGMKHSDADAVITMDVDGGHPVNVIEKMLKYYLEGYNVAQGHRIIYKRKNLYRGIASYIYNFFFFLIVGVSMFKQNVMFRLLDKKAKKIFSNNKSWWHFFKTNFKKKDDIKIKYVSYSAPERQLGESKYNFVRLLKLSIKAIFSMMALSRFVWINLILFTIIIFFLYNKQLIIAIVLLMIILLYSFSYAKIRNSYPLEKIIELESSFNSNN